MKKRQNVLLKSFGAGSLRDPELSALLKWVREEKNTCCDLISYKIESLIKDQKKYADIPCAGGMFYSSRIMESLFGVKSGFLTSEPYVDTAYFKLDAERVFRQSKGSYFAFPSPSSLPLEDAFYRDRYEFIGFLCDEYQKVMREQRDLGIKGHIVISNHFDAVELEELSKDNVLFFSPDGNSRTYAAVLEYQDSIAVSKNRLRVIFELMNEYDIKNVAVIDGERDDLDLCLSRFDPENICMGGFVSGYGEDYWKKLKERAYVLR
ncbi:hypothetical protein J2128_000741 [Methanomicrobium sp. W14]|uniref:hypothetical protein n=1 Tax=Methanomicrobium sp. W14 TaxID=2817839 RepID=UPI001AE3BACD|nr:hypothetical protein [Methanomicrobium sp. W14]MBP2132820.1 hypothetical protein [Methanomicrobium sp. W14]